eukprot:GFUD01025582.1.p1 GENE.GFUD01025582.1~~GFUD01025582.1.p1  ORF type:complete len:174 (-),score=37.92 GFUD01025582.1:97-618(-)
MFVSMLVLSLLAGGVHSANPLPEYMIGRFVLKTSEGFDAFMSALGIDSSIRAVFCALHFTAINTQHSNETITIETETSSEVTTITTFQLNTPFTETTADERIVTTTALLEENYLIKIQIGTPTIIETRGFALDGNTMRLIHTMPSNPEIKSVRVYARQDLAVDPEQSTFDGGC